ncbi:MAG TPA: phosphoribosylanthranilate isomerase [Candidatus Omnitrophota bacterium]|nr:phosphoribosylanthranilate isomerase [Candidatus Omnitrophota bacterium]HQJ16081.1 phosphoribosylanthranilate isomerase [Candidatus Omnitrophota bacterium]
MVKVKICGITNLDDAREAVKAGADAVGFVFHRPSPRYVAPSRARQIIRSLPVGVKKIGVFVNAKPARIKLIAARCSLDMVQLHGTESARACGRCWPLKVIKAFRLRRQEDLARVAGYRTFGYLFDAYVPGRPGGTGTTLPRGLRCAIRRVRLHGEVFLSGGLNARNVRAAIRSARPQWVDVSSSVESSPGKKDSRKMAAFVRVAKRMPLES